MSEDNGVVVLLAEAGSFVLRSFIQRGR
jgi:hypothetical protein